MRCLLVGNPNAGKTTLFNTLTGGFQRVGNWSGVTVADKASLFQLENEQVELVDLPGMYALDALDLKQKDEQVALNAIKSNDSDCVINVIDASQLERHLYLTSQLLELKRPLVIVLTMMDKAERCGIQIDVNQLSQILGCPVVDGSRGVDGNILKRVLESKLSIPKPLEFALTTKEESDAELAQLDARYTAVHELVLQVETRRTDRQEQLTAKLDRILLHRLFAFPLFLSAMYALFFLVISVGGFFQEQFMQLFDGLLVQGGAGVLQQMGCPDGLATWLINGFGLGLATTISFIPVMGVMFFLLACLEESGYMARVAFVMDRAMRFLGLPGKAFVPLIVGFGCNVPAVMATRTLDSRRDRRLAILMSPFMSCSARLTIYTVFVATFFPQGGYNIVFSLYLVGILMAVLTGLLLRRTVFSGPISPLLLELPVYQLPVWPVVLRGVIRKLRVFLWRAGRYILPVCMILGVLNVIPIAGGGSLLVWIGQGLQPVFAPMGISPDNWPAVVGLITGLLAKEVVIGSLNSMYASMGGLSQMFDGAISAYAYLLFVLLYVPCASTVAVIREEAGRHLMWFSVLWSTALAYASSVLFYQLGTASQHPEQTMLWVAGLMALLGVLVFWMRVGRLQGGSHAFRTS
ncbi:MAG: ferrous iron transport protein B [Gammaproteobacteria bacterium]|nr:ferrous iron transport protein B [Gammaproteobacteria bacterium]